MRWKKKAGNEKKNVIFFFIHPFVQSVDCNHSIPLFFLSFSLLPSSQPFSPAVFWGLSPVQIKKEMRDSETSEFIRVIVRVRPLSDEEVSAGEKEAIEIHPNGGALAVEVPATCTSSIAIATGMFSNQGQSSKTPQRTPARPSLAPTTPSSIQRKRTPSSRRSSISFQENQLVLQPPKQELASESLTVSDDTATIVSSDVLSRVCGSNQREAPTPNELSQNTTRKMFQFDRAFGPEITQQHLFDSEVAVFVEAAVQGNNSTVFVYGQTGAGKTHTMVGCKQQPGLINRALHLLFERQAEAKQNLRPFCIQTSFVELHLDQFVDLLDPSLLPNSLRKAMSTTGPSKSHPIFPEATCRTPKHSRPTAASTGRKRACGKISSQFPTTPSSLTPSSSSSSSSSSTSSGRIDIRYNSKTKTTFLSGSDGLCTTVSCEEYASQLIEYGLRNRAVARTKLNACSSRSHAILILHLVDPLTGTCFGKLNLVDLAGSERLQQSGAEGAALKETQNINSSLTALANVLSALSRRSKLQQTSSEAAASMIIPYRDSKLTFLLQDSLGGVGRTLFIVNLRPGKSHARESVLSLQYGTRTRTIRQLSAETNPWNSVAVAGSSEALIESLHLRVQQQQQLIDQLKDQISSTLPSNLSEQNAQYHSRLQRESEVEIKEQKNTIERLQQELKSIQQQNESSLFENKRHEEQYSSLLSERELELAEKTLQLSTFQLQIIDLEKQLHDLQLELLSSSVDSESKKNNLHRQLQHVEKLLDSSAQETDALKKIDSENQSLRKDLHENNQQMILLQNVISELHKSGAHLQSRKDHYKHLSMKLLGSSPSSILHLPSSNSRAKKLVVDKSVSNSPIMLKSPNRISRAQFPIAPSQRNDKENVGSPSLPEGEEMHGKFMVIQPYQLTSSAYMNKPKSLAPRLSSSSSSFSHRRYEVVSHDMADSSPVDTSATPTVVSPAYEAASGLLTATETVNCSFDEGKQEFLQDLLISSPILKKSSPALFDVEETGHPKPLDKEEPTQSHNQRRLSGGKRDRSSLKPSGVDFVAEQASPVAKQENEKLSLKPEKKRSKSQPETTKPSRGGTKRRPRAGQDNAEDDESHKDQPESAEEGDQETSRKEKTHLPLSLRKPSSSVAALKQLDQNSPVSSRPLSAKVVAPEQEKKGKKLKNLSHHTALIKSRASVHNGATSSGISIHKGLGALASSRNPTLMKFLNSNFLAKVK